MSAYDLDLHAWAHAQADALRRRSANEVDWENVAEEIESFGKQQPAELTNRLQVLVMHLMKWRYQPGHRSGSWSRTIKVQRRDAAKVLRQNPSLKPVVEEAFEDAYVSARLLALAETGLADDMMPPAPPFSAAQAMDQDFWPEVTPEQSPR